MDFGHDLLSFDSRRFDVPLQLQAELGSGRFDLLREYSPCAALRFVDRFSELRDSDMDMLSDLLHRIFQNKLIECHQSEGWIAWFDANAIPSRHFSDEPMNINHPAPVSDESKAIDLFEPISLHHLQ